MRIKTNQLITILLAIFVFMGLIISFNFIATFIFLLILPGFFIIDLLNREINLVEKIILGLGISLALIPLLTYIYRFFLPLNIYTILGTVTTFSLIFLVKRWQWIKEIKLGEEEVKISSLILIGILFLGIFTCMVPILNMNAPLFADPAVEGTITKLIVNNQGIPQTWEPFLDLNLEHQPGFASIIAWFHIVSGIKIPRIILFLTNILHAIFPLTIYLLVGDLFDNRFRRLISALIALLAAFPTYIFVAGMNSGVTMYFIVPILLFSIFRNLKEMKYRELVYISILSLGTFLIHPLFLFFIVVFTFPYIIIRRSNFSNPLKSISILFVIVIILPILFFLPTVLDKFNPSSTTSDLASRQWKIQSKYINPRGEISTGLFLDPIFMNFDNKSGYWYLYLEDLSLIQIPNYIFGFIFTGIFFYSIYIIFRQRNKYGFVAIAWYLLLILFGPLQTVLTLKYPGWQYIYPTRVKFLTVIPLSVMLSFGFTQGKEINLDRNFNDIWKVLPVLLILILYIPIGSNFIYGHLSDLSKRKGLSKNDLEGIEWIKKHTDRNSVILNTIGDIEAGAFIGGPGQWIPALTNRRVIFPATSLTENLERVSNRSVLMDYMARNEIENENFIKQLKDYNVSHVFISDRLFNSRGKYPKIKCNTFHRSSYFKLQFMGRGVCIFEFLPRKNN